MGDLVVQEQGSRLPATRNFSSLEPVLRSLGSARESAIMAYEPSHELLNELDAAIELAGRHRADLAAAVVPASLGMVGLYLAQLSEARPNAGKADHSFYSRTLRDDVMTLAPTEGAMETACRRWRQRSNFLPTIAEMMVEVRAARDELTGIAEFIERLPAIRGAIAAKLAR